MDVCSSLTMSLFIISDNRMMVWGVAIKKQTNEIKKEVTIN